jgi:signal transduction histidine kinase
LEYASLNKQEDPEVVDLNVVVKRVMQDLELAIEQKNAFIQQDPLPTVSGVPHQLHQLFYNILSNALKFSSHSTSPEIHIKVENVTAGTLAMTLPDPSRAYHLITVRDNGIGFQQEKADKIFVMFQRLHRREEYSGTGIGLALCKKVVTNHGGQIWATSEPGKGACFSMLLPVL